MNETNTAVPEGVNPVLWQLKREAEDELKRLREELSQVTNKLLAAEVILMQINRPNEHDAEKKFRLRKELPSDLEWEKLKVAKVRLEGELSQAERRLETELAAIRQAETSGGAVNRTTRAARELAELLEAGMRVLTDYTDKLDRIASTVPTAALDHRKDWGLWKMILDRLGNEYLAVSEPLRWWIRKLSAVHEEGRLTEVQRMELRLRLSELESKFQTVGLLLKQLDVLPPA